jgi:hypothetical protein
MVSKHFAPILTEQSPSFMEQPAPPFMEQHAPTFTKHTAPPHSKIPSRSRFPIMANDSDPCHLHNGNNPGIMLVTQPLNADNYQTWSQSMLMALITKNKEGFANGSIEALNPSSPCYSPWKRCDTMVLFLDLELFVQRDFCKCYIP